MWGSPHAQAGEGTESYTHTHTLSLSLSLQHSGFHGNSLQTGGSYPEQLLGGRLLRKRSQSPPRPQHCLLISMSVSEIDRPNLISSILAIPLVLYPDCTRAPHVPALQREREIFSFVRSLSLTQSWCHSNSTGHNPQLLDWPVVGSNSKSCCCPSESCGLARYYV